MHSLYVLCAALYEHPSEAASLDWSHDGQNNSPYADEAPDAGRAPRVFLLATSSAVASVPGEQGFLKRDAVEIEAPSPVETVQNEPGGWRSRAVELGAAARALTSMPEVESQRFWDHPTAALQALGPRLHSQLVQVQTKARSHVAYVANEAGLSVPLFVMGFVAVMVATLVILSVLLAPSKVRESYEPETRLQAAHHEQERLSARQPSNRASARVSPHVLCRELVVPRGNEFLFAMRSAVSRLPQSDRFDVVDPENCGFCSVVFCEKPEDAAFLGMQGILLRAAEPLAFLDTTPLFVRRSTGQLPLSRRALAGDEVKLQIFRPNGEVFGTLQLECDAPRRYGVRVDGTLLMSFLGDFRESAVTVHNAQGQLIATTEKHTFSFSLEPHVKVRAAHLVDTSVLMLGLIGCLKME